MRAASRFISTSSLIGTMLKSLLTLWPYVRRYRGGLALGMGALLMKDLLLAALPLVIKHGRCTAQD